MLPLAIKSNNAGDRLVIEPDRPDYWTATLQCSELHARRRFYELRIDSLPLFLDGLASNWRGWEGERNWKSLESDVEITATHNGRGNIALVVTLRNDVVDSDVTSGWTVRALLTLDAGTALDQLAREATLHLR
ncbi:DUF6228 family protein [Solirubrobacter taibaiensis]|nr:DUF6228 family protein [Solirubrobacter taibaiensis]